MSTVLIVIIAAVAVLLLLGALTALRRRRIVKGAEGRFEERRAKALDTRQHAAEHEVAAEQLSRESEQHERRAREAEVELAKHGR
jgi:hypothetical protein